MGYVFGGSSGGGGGGAPSGAAGGDLGGTYPNPTVTAVEAGTITNAMVNTSAAIAKSKLAALAIADADVASAAAIAYSKLALTGAVLNADLAGSIAPSKVTGTAVTAADSGTVTSAMIADATIVSADLSATAGITSGQLAGSIAPSKVTGTALTAADSGTVTTTILASGIPQSLSASGSSTKAIADTSAHVIGAPPTWNGTGWIGLGTPTYYLNGANANIAETLHRAWSQENIATVAIGTTGVMASYAIVLYAGQIITNITFRTGTTAGSAMTHWWVALYDTQATPALIAQSNDQTSTAIAASTTFTIALASPAPYTVATTGVYYVSIMVAATTIPTLTGSTGVGTSLSSGLVSGQKVLSQTSGSSLTTTAPGTITSATGTSNMPYFATS